MGKTVSVIVYIKVSVFSLVFGCLCCVLLLLLLLFTVFVCFVLVFFLLCLAFCFFGFVAALVNLFHLRSVKYTEALHTMKDLKSGKGLWS